MTHSQNTVSLARLPAQAKRTAIAVRDRRLTCLSPLFARLVHPPAVAAGRKEILEAWREGKQTDNDELISQATAGALELGFNRWWTSPLTERSASLARPVPARLPSSPSPPRSTFLRLVAVTLRDGHEQCRTPERMQMLMYVALDAVVDRAPLPKEKLAQILGPVVIIHPAADIVRAQPACRECFRQI